MVAKQVKRGFWGILGGFLCLLLAVSAYAGEVVQGYDLDKLADAVYWAEGGPKTKYPYGLISVPEFYTEDGGNRYYAKEILRVHLERCKDALDKILCVGDNYAPRSHHALNMNWVDNVKFFLANPKEVE